MLIDSHAHLMFPQFSGDLDELLVRARAAGVGQIVNVGTNLETSRAAIAMAETHDTVFASAGFHPADSEKADASSLKKLPDLLARRRVVAVGETGLDFYRNYAPREVQERAFRVHIRLACEMGMPLIIHSRAAETRVLDILEAEGGSKVGGAMHCFGGNAAEARRAVDLNFHLGFGGIVTFKNSHALKVALGVPVERLILETDCPFLAPVPKRASATSRRTCAMSPSAWRVPDAGNSTRCADRQRKMPRPCLDCHRETEKELGPAFSYQWRVCCADCGSRTNRQRGLGRRNRPWPRRADGLFARAGRPGHRH